MIQSSQNETRVKDFDVRVGHWTFQVRGASRTEALEVARQRLCRDLPRLWDVIRSLRDEEILVEEKQAPDSRAK